MWGGGRGLGVEGVSSAGVLEGGRRLLEWLHSRLCLQCGLELLGVREEFRCGFLSCLRVREVVAGCKRRVESGGLLLVTLRNGV